MLIVLCVTLLFSKSRSYIKVHSWHIMILLEHSTGTICVSVTMRGNRGSRTNHSVAKRFRKVDFTLQIAFVGPKLVSNSCSTNFSSLEMKTKGWRNDSIPVYDVYGLQLFSKRGSGA